MNAQVECGIDSSLFHLEAIFAAEYKLVTGRVFDREQESHHIVTVRCRDAGLPHLVTMKTISVQITDENDNAPQLASNIFFVNLKENNLLYATVVKMNATDADDGRNGALMYRLDPLEGTPKEGLSIDPVSGTIAASVVFDYEKRQSYSYLMTVKDRGDAPKSGAATLILNIVDVNDEVPVFEMPSYFFTVVENRPAGTVIGQVKAYDVDATAEYQRITYSMEGVGSKAFRVDPTSGEILARTVLDREEVAVYKFRVRAANDPDYSQLPIYSSVNVTVSG